MCWCVVWCRICSVLKSFTLRTNARSDRQMWKTTNTNPNMLVELFQLDVVGLSLASRAVYGNRKHMMHAYTQTYRRMLRFASISISFSAFPIFFINYCGFFFHSIFATSLTYMRRARISFWINRLRVLIYEMRSTITKSVCFILYKLLFVRLSFIIFFCMPVKFALHSRQHSTVEKFTASEISYIPASSVLCDKFKSCWKENVSKS